MSFYLAAGTWIIKFTNDFWFSGWKHYSFSSSWEIHDFIYKILVTGQFYIDEENVEIEALG